MTSISDEAHAGNRAWLREHEKLRQRQLSEKPILTAIGRFIGGAFLALGALTIIGGLLMEPGAPYWDFGKEFRYRTAQFREWTLGAQGDTEYSAMKVEMAKLRPFLPAFKYTWVAHTAQLAPDHRRAFIAGFDDYATCANEARIHASLWEHQTVIYQCAKHCKPGSAFLIWNDIRCDEYRTVTLPG